MGNVKQGDIILLKRLAPIIAPTMNVFHRTNPPMLIKDAGYMFVDDDTPLFLSGYRFTRDVKFTGYQVINAHTGYEVLKDDAIRDDIMQKVTVYQKVRQKAREIVFSYSADEIDRFDPDITGLDLKKFFGLSDDDIYKPSDVIGVWYMFVKEFLDELAPDRNDPIKNAQRRISELLEDEDRKLSIAFDILFDALQKKEMNNED